MAMGRRENSFLQVPRQRSVSPLQSRPRQRSMFDENKRRRVEFRNETPDIVHLPDENQLQDCSDAGRLFDSNRLSVDTLSLGSSPPRSILKKRQLTPELPRRSVSLSPTPCLTLTGAASLSDVNDDVTRLPRLSSAETINVNGGYKISATQSSKHYLSPDGQTSPKPGIKFQCSKEFARAFEKLDDSGS